MKRNIIIVAAIALMSIVLIVESCVTSKKVAGKDGSQLWSENCQRCHNAPPISAFTSSEWGIVNLHMRQRAVLTDDQYKKILAFMQQKD
ncbi:cytochrome c [Mucilaginibacter rubeus]|uniref:Cytochrome c n=1 Tax=Mucilaginibacter rubeus TaxID=2027860 RepID=A0AAE6JM49_9SPHI|nr:MULTISPECIES: cytochrome c [Mucilaginibacter]NHA05570.1 cytochrome c [Mucilaginibacter inviolabilis]QEM07112.1 cytochrome c [Mucilaginibacter rubeus]QTE35378.1 cytochrome c [Mucilaginibacter gossypii]QTE43745.1 cytochrome c [Mucilaginibacter rubeus]QTE50344.1 cytochrome c [Mucilaginibacter rubeus]